MANFVRSILIAAVALLFGGSVATEASASEHHTPRDVEALHAGSTAIDGVRDAFDAAILLDALTASPRVADVDFDGATTRNDVVMIVAALRGSDAPARVGTPGLPVPVQPATASALATAPVSPRTHDRRQHDTVATAITDDSAAAVCQSGLAREESAAYHAPAMVGQPVRGPPLV